MPRNLQYVQGRHYATCLIPILDIGFQIGRRASLSTPMRFHKRGIKVFGKVAYEAVLPLWSCQQRDPLPEIRERLRKRALRPGSRIGDHSKEVPECRLHIFGLPSLLTFIK